MSDPTKLPPLLCSQGGFAYNREHIDYWQQCAEKAEAERDEWKATAETVSMLRDKACAAIEAEKDAEIARLRGLLNYGTDTDAYRTLRKRNDELKARAEKAEAERDAIKGAARELLELLDNGATVETFGVAKLKLGALIGWTPAPALDDF